MSETGVMTFKDMVGDPALPPELVDNSHAPDLVCFALILCVPVLYLLLRRWFAGPKLPPESRAAGLDLCAQTAAAAAVLPLGYVTLRAATDTGGWADLLGEFCGIYGIAYACIGLAKSIRSLAALKKTPMALPPANGAWPFILAAVIFMLRLGAAGLSLIHWEWGVPQAHLLFALASLTGGLVLTPLALRARSVLSLRAMMGLLLAIACLPVASTFGAHREGLALPYIGLALLFAALLGPWSALRFMPEFRHIRKQARWGWAVVLMSPFVVMSLALQVLLHIIKWPMFIAAAGAAVAGLYRGAPAPISAWASCSTAWHRAKTGVCYGIPLCVAVYFLLMAPFSMMTWGDGEEGYEREAAALRPLVALGSAKAELYTGFVWSNVNNPRHSDAEALNWYRAAAEHGDVFTMLMLANDYTYGTEGVSKDLAEAAKWTRKAAERDDAGAQSVLAGMYRDGGEGLEKNPVAAARWYLKAAAQGRSEAYAALYEMYKAGEGVPQDDAEACFWLMVDRRSYKQAGMERLAPDDDPELRKRLSPDQTAAVQKRVEDWQPVPEDSLGSGFVIWPF